MQAKWVIYCMMLFASLGALVVTSAMLHKSWRAIESCNRGPWIAIMCQVSVVFLNACWFIQVFDRFGEYMRAFVSVIVNWFMFTINLAVFCAEIRFIANWETCESLDALKAVCIIYASFYTVAFVVGAIVLSGVRCSAQDEAV